MKESLKVTTENTKEIFLEQIEGLIVRWFDFLRESSDIVYSPKIKKARMVFNAWVVPEKLFPGFIRVAAEKEMEGDFSVKTGNEGWIVKIDSPFLERRVFCLFSEDCLRNSFVETYEDDVFEVRPEKLCVKDVEFLSILLKASKVSGNNKRT